MLPTRVRLAVLCACTVLLAPCTPEGDQRHPVGARLTDPCAGKGLDLSNGIDDGDEAMRLFACLNKTGALDSLANLMAVLNTTPSSDPTRSLLDLWVDAWHTNRAAAASPGGDADALITTLDHASQALTEPWTHGLLQLTGDALAAGLAEPLVALQGHYASAFLKLKLRDPDAYHAYFPMLGDFLCPNGTSTGVCTGQARLLLDGWNAMHADDAQHGDTSTCRAGAGQDLAQALADTFPSGDSTRTQPSVTSLANAIADLGKDTFLADGLSRVYPEMYGDDPRTEALEPGYPLYDTDRSALYSLLSRFSTSDGLAMLETYFGANVAIQTHCYLYAPDTPDGYVAVDRYEAYCTPGEGKWALAHPATSGIAQMLRLVAAVDVTVPDDTLRGRLVDLFTEVAGMEYELSGSNNLAVLVLEFFAQLPKETVIYLVEMAAGNPQGIEVFNAVFGTHVMIDDMQSLKAAVVDEDENGGVGLFLEIIQAINAASQPDGIGGLGTFKNLLVSWYETGFWEDFYPYFLETLGSPDTSGTADTTGDPTPDPNGATGASLETFQSLAPGGTYHDTVTLPLLKLLYSMAGDPMRRLVTPIAGGLRASAPAMEALFSALGRMGTRALEVYQQSPSTPTGLDCVPTLQARLEQATGQDDPLVSLFEAFHDPALIDAWVETLASPAVRDAIVSPSPNGSPSPIQALATHIEDGTLDALLDRLQGILRDLDTAPEVANSETGTPVP